MHAFSFFFSFLFLFLFHITLTFPHPLHSSLTSLFNKLIPHGLLGYLTFDPGSVTPVCPRSASCHHTSSLSFKALQSRSAERPIRASLSLERAVRPGLDSNPCRKATHNMLVRRRMRGLWEKISDIWKKKKTQFKTLQQMLHVLT